MKVSQAIVLLIMVSIAAPVFADSHSAAVQLGPRPYYLIQDMEDSALKTDLEKCANGPFEKKDFSIGHRGTPMQFPEHTKESYVAAARMGAGILDCDVTFTKDKLIWSNSRPMARPFSWLTKVNLTWAPAMTRRAQSPWLMSPAALKGKHDPDFVQEI